MVCEKVMEGKSPILVISENAYIDKYHNKQMVMLNTAASAIDYDRYMDSTAESPTVIESGANRQDLPLSTIGRERTSAGVDCEQETAHVRSAQ